MDDRNFDDTPPDAPADYAPDIDNGPDDDDRDPQGVPGGDDGWIDRPEAAWHENPSANAADGPAVFDDDNDDDQAGFSLPDLDRSDDDTRAPAVVLGSGDDAPDRPGSHLLLPLDDGADLGDASPVHAEHPINDVLAHDRAEDDARITLAPLDDTDEGSSGDTADDGGIADAGAPLLVGDDEHAAFADITEHNGNWNEGVVAAALAAAAGVAVASVTGRIASHAQRTRRAFDAGGVAGIADELGVDACVEHGNVERLRATIARGGTVLLEATRDADPLALVDCGTDRIVVQPLSGGGRRSAPLSTLRAAWADTAGQLVSIEGGDRPIVVLPVVLPDHVLSPVPP
jgi:hypothetical protein